MKREFLEGLGLEKEAIDKIMAENGKDIQVEKAKLKPLEDEKNSLISALEEANKTIKSYTDMDIESIKKSASTWEEKAKAKEVELEAIKKTSALKEALLKTNAQDIEVLLKVLDQDALIYETDEIKGLDAQIKHLTETKPYLFKTEKQDGFNPHVPGDDSAGGEGKSQMEMQIDAVFNS